MDNFSTGCPQVFPQAVDNVVHRLSTGCSQAVDNVFHRVFHSRARVRSNTRSSNVRSVPARIVRRSKGSMVEWFDGRTITIATKRGRVLAVASTPRARSRERAEGGRAHSRERADGGADERGPRGPTRGGRGGREGADERGPTTTKTRAGTGIAAPARKSFRKALTVATGSSILTPVAGSTAD